MRYSPQTSGCSILNFENWELVLTKKAVQVAKKSQTTLQGSYQNQNILENKRKMDAQPNKCPSLLKILFPSGKICSKVNTFVKSEYQET